MDVFEAIDSRYSVRGYKADPVDDRTLGRVLEAARRAPTAANRQPFRLVIAHTEGRETELLRIYGRPWFVQAPLIVCVPKRYLPAWNAFSDGLDQQLPPRREAIEAWFEAIAPSPSTRAAAGA